MRDKQPSDSQRPANAGANANANASVNANASERRLHAGASNGNSTSGAGEDAALLPYQDGVPQAWSPPVVAGAGAGAGESAFKPSPLRSILDLLWRRRKLVVPIFLIVVVLGALKAWSAPRVYQAQATLLANTAPLGGKTKSSSEEDPLQTGDVEGVNQSRNLKTQMEVVRTSTVINGAFAKLTPDQQNSLRKFYSVDIGTVRDTDLITVAATSYDPKVSAALANAICDSYIEKSLESNRREIGGTARFVKGQLETVRVQLNKARNDFRDFQQKNNITDVAIQTSTVNETLNGQKSALRQAQSDLASRRAQLVQLEASIAGVPPEIVSTKIGTNTDNQTLRAQLTQLQIDRAALLVQYRPESNKVQDINAQIRRIKAQLAAQPRTENLGEERAPNPTYVELRQQIETARGDATALAARVATLQNSIGRAAQDLSDLPAKTARFNQLNNTVNRLELTANTLDQKYQALKINEEARLANASIASLATPPGAPNGGSRSRALLMALALGLALAYGAALLVDRFDEKIHSSAQAEAAGRLPVLLDVPYIKDARQQCILSADSSLLLESFEMLTAQVALTGRGAPVKSVVLTSALPGEGKSVSCVNLAIAAAMSGQRVIVVDCDLRQSRLHQIFGLPRGRGFSDVVRGGCDLETAIQPTRIAGLELLSGGNAPQRPLEVLRSPQAQACLETLKARYDLVILDTPPTLLIADATLLASQVDATLVVVSCKEASEREIARATNLLWQTGAHLMGIVLTKVPAELGRNYSYSSYYGGNSGSLQNELHAADELAADELAADAPTTAEPTLVSHNGHHNGQSNGVGTDENSASSQN